MRKSLFNERAIQHFLHTTKKKSNLISLFLNILQRFVYVAATSIWKLKDLMNTWKISSKTMSDALDVSSAPVIFSHSSARGVYDHERNVPDDILLRVVGYSHQCFLFQQNCTKEIHSI